MKEFIFLVDSKYKTSINIKPIEHDIIRYLIGLIYKAYPKWFVKVTTYQKTI